MAKKQLEIITTQQNIYILKIINQKQGIKEVYRWLKNQYSEE